MGSTKLSLVGLALAAVLFVALNAFSLNSLVGLRLDLSEDKLYTLSEGAHEIVAGLQEEVRLEYYFSQQLSDEEGAFATEGRRVRELLDEFVQASRGKLVLEVIDPEPFSEAEDDAVAAGVAPLSLRNMSDSFYFGLSASGAAGERRAIPYFDPTQERFLEYEIARLIHGVENPDRPVVGLLSSLPVAGNPMAAAMGGPPEPAWSILAQLEGQLEVRELRAPLAAVPDDIDVLWVVHPRELSERTQFAIDQYVLGGGRALVMVDPFCESQPVPQDPNNPYAALTAPRDSSLPALFEAWGIEQVSGTLAADRANAQRVSFSDPVRGRVDVDFVVWPSIAGDGFNREDPTTAELQQLRMAFPGVLRARDDATTEVTTLLQTGPESMQIPTARVQGPGSSPQELLTSFLPEGRPLALAVRVTGPAQSAFPDGPPAAQGAEGAEEPWTAEVLAESSGPIQVAVVADCDFLADRMWIRANRMGNVVLSYSKMGDNGDFVLNALEGLGGSDALISLRGRGRFTRPFERVEELRRDAEERHLREQQALEDELAEAQQRFFSLQREKSDEELAMITPEQLEELERSRREMLETRKKLRDVRHDLRKDIDSLGTRLKWINMGLVPLLVTLIAVVQGLWRFKRGS